MSISLYPHKLLLPKVFTVVYKNILCLISFSDKFNTFLFVHKRQYYVKGNHKNLQNAQVQTYLQI